MQTQTATAQRSAQGTNGFAQSRGGALAPAGAAPMPTRQQFKKFSECTNIDDMLRHPDMGERVKAALPRHLSPERMLRVMALAVYKTPDLRKCEPMSLLGAMLVCASLGLEPNTPLGHAYLIPFKTRKKGPEGWYETYDVQLVIGYRGYVDLARRSGHVIALHADIVYDGDDFSFEYGSNQHLRHVPLGAREGRQPLWAYCHAKLTDGEAFEVLPYAEVLRIRNQSQGYQQAMRIKADKGASAPGYLKNPWVAFEHEMSAKTLVRRVSKMLPLSIEFANAAQLDAMSETGGADLARVAMSSDIGGALEGGDYEMVDEDGVVIDQQDDGRGQQQEQTDSGHGGQTHQPVDSRPAEQTQQRRQAATRTRQAAPPAPPPPPPPPAVQQEEQKPPAFVLVDADGEEIYWDDAADIKGAYDEFEAQLNVANGRGAQVLAGFVETNAGLIEQFRKGGYAISPLVPHHTAAKDETAQPADPAAASKKGLF